ncbi:DUF4348 domain-containing protein [Paludibacter sp. 221]|uniref:DUF4348 domain-containing protein n=1 Tax=Paludibacter sp. 221 TaxID=2302939 RepID=UPI0013D6F982|nr:DUF6056 family protein [Paludibacter sp. 221]NDV47903.1 DUF4348 domain-containing protein [Paludibacter sp. 221]
MKKAAKILCIIALVIGIIWAVVGFFGSWVGGAVISAGQEVFAEDSQGANSTMENSVNVMLKFIGSFVIVIIGGVLGIIGSDKKPSKVKPLIFGVLTLICGIILFPLHNYVAAFLYLVAGLLLVLGGLTTKTQNKNESKDNKKLILTGIVLGIVIVVVGFCLTQNNSVTENQEITIANSDNTTDIINTEQSASATPNNEDFQDFIQKFTSDKNFQLSRIKFPLSSIKSKDEWEFLDANVIFEGTKILGSGLNEQGEEVGYEFSGEFIKKSDSKYFYSFYNSDFGETIFTFSKVEGQWMLTDDLDEDGECYR